MSLNSDHPARPQPHLHSSLVLDVESNPSSFRSTQSTEGTRRGGSANQNAKFIGSSPHSKSPAYERQNSDGSTAGTFAELETINAAFLGIPGSLLHRIVFLGSNGQKLVSPLNEIPIHGPENLLVSVCKTSAGHWIQYECATEEPFNPLRPVETGSSLKGALEKVNDGSLWQKVRNIVARSVRPVHYPDNAPWNVGFLPQTYVSKSAVKDLPLATNDFTLEVIDVGAETLLKTGSVYCIKPLGGFTLEGNKGEKLWKIIGISSKDSMAPLINDVTDLSSYLPGLLDLVVDWLKSCIAAAKVPHGSVEVHGPHSLPSALAVISDAHRSWYRYKEHTTIEPPASLKKSHQFSSLELEVCWKQYTHKEQTSLFREAIPLSCPLSESNILFQEAWIEPEGEEHVEQYSHSFKEEEKERKTDSPGKSERTVIVATGNNNSFKNKPEGKPGLLFTAGGGKSADPGGKGGGKVVFKTAPPKATVPASNGSLKLGSIPNYSSSKDGNMSPKSDISSRSGDASSQRSSDAGARKLKLYGNSAAKVAEKVQPTQTISRSFFTRAKKEEKPHADDKVVPLGLRAVRKMSNR